MSIEFHCPKCGKGIKAPDDGGGKRGECPSCHQSVYIPTPEDKLEPLDLAPIDETEEQQREEMLKESQRLMEETRHASSAPAEDSPRAGGKAPASATPDVDVYQLVIQFAEKMSAGDLGDAESIGRTLRRYPQKTQEAVDQILMDEMPPNELADIPRPVLSGFLKQLTQKG
jgi:hypothetical protein